jgi:hypothetical protein
MKWDLTEAKVGTKMRTDRAEYVLSVVPAEMAGGTLVVRQATEHDFWLTDEALDAKGDVKVFAIVRVRMGDEVKFGPSAQADLVKDGWKEVPAKVATTHPEGEVWEWKAYEIIHARGEIVLPLKNLDWDKTRTGVLFVVKACDLKKEPISAAEFRGPGGVIETLSRAPAGGVLAAAVRRLALTDPSEDQKKKHDEYKKQKLLVKGNFGSPKVLAEAEEKDDVLAVSRGLSKMKAVGVLEQKDLADALLKWATEENLEQLIALTEASGRESDVRIAACQALTRFPDQRGADAIAARFISARPPEDEKARQALHKYPDRSMAEEAVLKRLDDKMENPARLRAVLLLAHIGSPQSRPRLQKLEGDPHCRVAARNALEAIDRRYPK